jgi:hypothetical protein
MKGTDGCCVFCRSESAWVFTARREWDLFADHSATPLLAWSASTRDEATTLQAFRQELDFMNWAMATFPSTPGFYSATGVQLVSEMSGYIQSYVDAGALPKDWLLAGVIRLVLALEPLAVIEWGANDPDVAHLCAYRLHFCAACGKPASSKCGKCQAVAFCSRDCQVLNWKTHKGACRNSKAP